MKGIALWLAGAGVVVAGAVAVLYLAVPPNRTVEEGPADPILGVRRPAIKALQAIKIVRFDERFPNPYLPTRSWEPVYRGLFWPVGWRVTRRVTDYNDLGMRAVRLCYAVGNERFVAAEEESAGERSVDVSGFIPLSARGVWTELTDRDGEVRSVSGSGNVDPFWRD